MSIYLLDSPSETRRLAELLARNYLRHARLVIFLSGELGTGKTTFARFFIRALGYRDLVRSPTYTLLEAYQFAEHPIFHVDLYRLRQPAELLDIGLQDEFDQAAIWLIEWPERASSLLPTPDITCHFVITGSRRELTLCAQTVDGRQLLERCSAHES